MNVLDRIKNCNFVTFLNQTFIESKNNGIFGKINKKKLERLRNKLLERNIYLLLMSPEDELSIRSDPNLKFNDSNIYNNNKLYFRLENFSDKVFKFYTIDRIYSKIEDYKQELFYNVITNFGLKSATLEYLNENINIDDFKLSASSSATVNDIKYIDSKTGLEVKHNKKNSRKIINKREYERMSTPNLFKCLDTRSYWCQEIYGKLKNYRDIVKEIMMNNRNFTIESYDNSTQLDDFLNSRINGSNIIIYEVSEHNNYQETFKFYSKIGSQFSGFGFNTDISLSHDITNRNNKHLIITAEFYTIEELEVKTLTNVLEYYNNSKNFKKDVLKMLKDKYKELNEIYCERLRLEIKKLNKEKLEDEDNIELSLDIIKLKNNLDEQKKNYKKIMKEREIEEEHFRSLVPHIGDWNTGRSENRAPYWSCCGSTQFSNSSCTRVKPMGNRVRWTRRY